MPAFHSKLAAMRIHHNNSACTEGNNIERANRKRGKGGLPLCAHCERLD